MSRSFTQPNWKTAIHNTPTEEEMTMSQKPPSVETLIQNFSKARVLAPSKKREVIGFDLMGMPKFTRELTDQDVRDQMVRKYAR